MRTALPRHAALALALGACGGEAEETLPECTVVASFSGGLTGTLSLADAGGNCGGRSGGGYSGGRWFDGTYSVGVLLSDSLVITPGTTVDDVDARLEVFDVDRDLTFEAVDCRADVDTIEEHTWWAGTETFVGGTLTCDEPLTSDAGEATLNGDAAFYYQVF